MTIYAVVDSETPVFKWNNTYYGDPNPMEIAADTIYKIRNEERLYYVTDRYLLSSCSVRSQMFAKHCEIINLRNADFAMAHLNTEHKAIHLDQNVICSCRIEVVINSMGNTRIAHSDLNDDDREVVDIAQQYIDDMQVELNEEFKAWWNNPINFTVPATVSVRTPVDGTPYAGMRCVELYDHDKYIEYIKYVACAHEAISFV